MSLRGFMAVILVLLWLGAIYAGYVSMVKRAMRSTPQPDSTRSLRLEQEQKEKIKDIHDQQKRLMETRESQLRDLQNQRLRQDPKAIRERQKQLIEDRKTRMEDMRSRMRDLQRR